MSQELKINAAYLEEVGALRGMLAAGLDEKTARREMSFAAQLWAAKPDLQKCTPKSFLVAVVNVANIGLTLNPAAKQAYLIGRWNKAINGYEATLEPSYMGLLHLAIQAGGIRSAMCDVVHENDSITFEPTNPREPVRHIPVWKSRGPMIGVYAVATLPNGDRQAERMLLEEVEEVRERSDSWKSFSAGKLTTCTWHSDFSEMSRKTVLKRLLKYVPKGTGPKQEALDRAIEADNFDYSAEAWQLMQIEQLSNALEEKELVMLESELRGGITRYRAGEIIRFLEGRQPQQEATNATIARRLVAEKVADPKS